MSAGSAHRLPVLAGGPPSRDRLVAVSPARNAVGVVFALNGLLFASLISRVPDLRRALDLDNSSLGLLLLAIAAGSLIALPSSGRLIDRWGAATVMRGGAVLVAVGLSATAAGAGPVGLGGRHAAAGLFAYGVGTGVWDVAMNVEGAEVERRLGRTIMPRFHAGFSLGTMGGAGIGVLVAAVDVPMLGHLAVLSVVALVATTSASPALPGGRGAAGGRGAVGLGLDRAAHPPGRRHGADLRRGRGHRQRLDLAGAHRRLRRPRVGGRHRVRPLRDRHDRGSAPRPTRPGPIRSRPGAVGAARRRWPPESP